MLNYIEEHRGGDARPLVIAHGLFGSARNWGVISRRLSDRGRVVAVDMRNHGDSFHAPAHGYEEMAADLAGVIEALGGKADLLGHSMGGKAAMVLALTRPELVGQLVIADIAPVAYGHSQIPYVRAMEAVDLSRVERRSDADAQLGEVVPDPALRSFLLQSLAVAEGGARWKLNLSALAEEMPRIMSFPDIAATYDRPALFLRGGASDYVAGDHAEAIAPLFPDARVEAMDGLGHWLHAEDPRGFEARVRDALDWSDG